MGYFILPSRRQLFDNKAVVLVFGAGFLLFLACAGFAGPTKSGANSPDASPSQRSEGQAVEAAAMGGPDWASEVSERQKWSRARRAFSRAQKEEKAAHIDSAAFYYELSLQYLCAIDLGAIDISMKHVLAVQRKVQTSYDKFLGGLKELPTTAGTQAVLTEVEPGPKGESEAPGDLFEEPETKKESKSAPDTEIVVVPPIQPIRPISMLPPVPVVHNEHIEAAIRFFQGRGRKVMIEWMSRTAEVFPRLRPILREEGMPDELLFLAMIESGLKYKAYSRARASGIWQFIPGTGRIYGLQVGRYYDERRHVEKETYAACHYLRKLYEEFGDWYLAMAAYNCGEKRIEREVRRHNSRSFWQLKRLPQQTRNYIPTYLAARMICENPQKYGFPPMPKEKPWSCQTVWVKGAYRLNDIARSAGVSVDEVIELNPEFLHGATYSPYDSVMVRLPVRASSGVAAALGTLRQETRLPDATEHRVRRGETLSQIAGKYQTTVSEILSLPENSSVRLKRLRAGQIVHVPMAPAKQVSPPPVAPTRVSAPDNLITYTVQRGQSLSQIGRLLGVSVDELCAWNHIRNRNIVQPGQKLVVHVSAPSVESTALADTIPLYHTVRRGETISTIAAHYGRQAAEILRWNNLSGGDFIYPGQKLRVKPE